MRQFRKNVITIAGFFTLMAGCSSMLLPRDETREIADLLTRYEHLATAKSEEQRRELNAAQAAYEKTPNDTTRLSLALTLLLFHPPVRDDARIQVLLGGIKTISDKSGSPRYDLAQLLIKLIAEQQRELREERHKTEEMQQKIEALRTIDREWGARRKTP